MLTLKEAPLRASRTFRTLATLLTFGVLSGCASERADLEVSLTPPIASRFLVHGNCFAGWYIALDVVVAETRGVGERMVDATFLRDRLGESGSLLRGPSSVRIPISVGALNGSVDAPAISGSIVGSGVVLAADERGTVRSAYRIPAVVRVENPPLPMAGACNQAAAGR